MMGFLITLLGCLVVVLVVLPVVGLGFRLWFGESPEAVRARLLAWRPPGRWAWWRDALLVFGLGVVVLGSVAGVVVARGGSPWLCVVAGGWVGAWLGWEKGGQ